jgi:hypothetical protein
MTAFHFVRVENPRKSALKTSRANCDTPGTFFVTFSDEGHFDVSRGIFNVNKQMQSGEPCLPTGVTSTHTSGECRKIFRVFLHHKWLVSGHFQGLFTQNTRN